MGLRRTERIRRDRARQRVGRRKWPDFHSPEIVKRPAHRADRIERAALHPQATSRIHEFAKVLHEKEFDASTHNAAFNALLAIHRQSGSRNARQALQTAINRLNKRKTLLLEQRALIKRMQKALQEI